MARQSLQPINFGTSVRTDTSALMSSARAGVVFPIAQIPMLRGDSCSGNFGIDIQLAEMPKPLLNAVQANVQIWFVPKTAFPWFSSYDEFLHSYQKEPIKQLGAVDRSPPPFYQMTIGAGAQNQLRNSTFIRTMGVHLPPGSAAHFNSDVVDAFNLIYNFRLAAHSSKLPRRKYFSENNSEAVELPPAFWPTNRFSRVVPDYERALVVGALDLDVSAGQVPLTGDGDVILKAANRIAGRWVKADGTPMTTASSAGGPAGSGNLRMDPAVAGGARTQVEGGATTSQGSPRYSDVGFDPNGSLAIALGGINANMASTTIKTSLANVDKARIVQAFAQQRSAMAGNDYTGFDNEDVMLAELMQGFAVPDTERNRPWLLAQKRVTFGMEERHATDGANLDKSVTQGRASISLSFAVPRNDFGGYIIITGEVLPERIYERQKDITYLLNDPAQLPDALRDIQRPEPVDIVENSRLDTQHATPNQTYGYEPMNDVWNREFTRLGGVFFKETPATAWTENRASIWSPEMVNPTYTAAHFLAPKPFPHDVFADTTAPAFEFVARHDCSIVGLTQIGDVLVENNDDYQEIIDA